MDELSPTCAAGMGHGRAEEVRSGWADELSPTRADELLEAARGLRVLVVGDVMLDRYVAGRVERISPEAPVPVVRVERETYGLGGAGNVAANVAALGARCRVVGCVGADRAGERVRQELERVGVLVDALEVATDRPTTLKTRVLARGQQVVRFDEEVTDDLPPDLAALLASAASSHAADSDVLVMEDYDKGVLGPDVIDAVVAAGARVGVPSVADPKRRNFFAYGGVTLLKPNAKELEDAVGERIRPDDPAWMEAQRRRLGCQSLLVTLGALGMALQTRVICDAKTGDGETGHGTTGNGKTGEGRHVRVPAVARAVFDVSGAGDTVTAVAALALAAGALPSEAAALANHAAAVEVEKAGVATVSPAEIRAHVRSHRRRSC